jgi:hypothetical protein
VLAGLVVLHVVMAGLALAGHPQHYTIGPLDVRFISVPRALATAAVAAAAALALSPEARAALVSATRSVPVFLGAAALLAAWLSLGPLVRSHGRPLPVFGLYGVLYDHVPGFDGVRVPARMGMIVGLFLTALAGCAAAQLARGRRAAILLVSASGALCLVEGLAVPITLYVPPACSPIYESVARLPDEAVIAELPLGDPYRDVQYMFCSTHHWRRLVNGYSGAVPAAYARGAYALQNVLRDPEAAWVALVGLGASHAVIHQAAWPGARGTRIATALEAHGAIRVAAAGTDAVYDLTARARVRTPAAPRAGGE